MTTPLKFFAASDGVAMSVDSLTTLLDNDLQLLTYVVKFNVSLLVEIHF
jgi:hypothetical protein